MKSQEESLISNIQIFWIPVITIVYWNFYFYDNGIDWEENYWDLNILCKKQLIKHSRPFAGISRDYSCWYWYLWWWTEQFLEQIVQIYVISISNKSILMKRKEWYNVSWTLLYTRAQWSPIFGGENMENILQREKKCTV